MDFEKRQIVIDNVHRFIDIAERAFNIEIPMPAIRFDLRGRTAGSANFGKWELRFNETLMLQNFEDFAEQTVGHEVAHLVENRVYGWMHANKKRYPAHGKTWKKVMMVFGLDPKRCHNYDTSKSVGRRTKKYVYECECCGAFIEMGAVRHKRMKLGEKTYYHSHCGRKGKLNYVCPA